MSDVETRQPERGFVQLSPREALWVRGDTGVCNLTYVKSLAVHTVKDGWMVWAHGSMRESKAIPLLKCLTEEEAQAALDQIVGLVGALDIRIIREVT